MATGKPKKNYAKNKAFKALRNSFAPAGAPNWYLNPSNTPPMTPGGGGYSSTAPSNSGLAYVNPGQLYQPAYGQGFNDIYNPNIFVLFYGFNGLLAQKYSLIENMSVDEIRARMEIAGDKVPWKLEGYEDFMKICNMFSGTPNALVAIDFADAMNTIRIGVQKEVVVDDFEEPEEDEFDDNCVPSCKPGLHTCGK